MATVVVPRDERRGDRSDWSRKYPPLVAIAVALAIALFVLPSSLNLPNANPSTTVELAPVPPQDDNPPPVQSNISTLSFGNSATVNGGGASGGNGAGGPLNPDGTPALPPPVPSVLKSKTPSTKNCVGTPPRQTEDPLSPPCVADFTGDNGAATYQGVAKDEIRILLYDDGGIVQTGGPRGTDGYPENTILDLDAPPQSNEIGEVFTSRAWEQYFNNRYQTYGRHAHFYIQFASRDRNATPGPTTPATRQADAAEAYARVRPFAVINYATFNGNTDFYLQYMAQHGVLNFGSTTGRTSTFFNQYPKLVWGFPPPIEQDATEFASFVCAKMAKNPVSYSGSGTAHGQPRKFGLVETSDKAFPTFTKEAELVRAQLKQCGITISDNDVVQFPTNGYTVDNGNSPQFAVNNMLKLSRDKVTTLLWPVGLEIKQSAAATQLGYFPEWLLGDDLFQSGNTVAQQQDQSQWRDAWTLTAVTHTDTLHQQLCYTAYREVDPNAADSDVQNSACPKYNDLRQIFTGIQVAGPKLGPFSIDKGYHAIPDVSSVDPRVPACFYLPNDYTCVKDAEVEWWDSSAAGYGTTNQGCWKMTDDGRRYITGQFPSGDITAQRNPGRDACNAYDANYNINPYPPGTN